MSSTADRRGHTLCFGLLTAVGAAWGAHAWGGGRAGRAGGGGGGGGSDLGRSDEIDADRRETPRCQPVCGLGGDRRDRSVERNRRMQRDRGGVMVVFELDRGDVAEGAVQPVVVKPCDPFDGRELQLRL